MSIKERRYIPLISRDESCKLPTDEVCYIVRSSRTLQFITDNGKEHMYGKIDNILEYLGPEFFRCSSGCIINLSRIKRIRSGIVYFDNGTTFGAGREIYSKIKIRFNAYMVDMLPKNKDIIK